MDIKGLILRVRIAMAMVASYLKYRYKIATGKVFFGEFMAARQGDPRRHYYMQMLVKNECYGQDKGKFMILEVGSWAGGSAITWAEAVKKYNPAGGEIICVDPWVDYIDPQINKDFAYGYMKKAFVKDRIFSLFLHNIRASGYADIITVHRGFSGDILPKQKHEHFDLVYIDGDHSYDGALQDLKFAAPLIKDGGIICGDDLELQYPFVDKENLERVKGIDFATDPVNQRHFHPGLCIAVWEFFGKKVSAWEGFWAMRKSADGWERVNLILDEDFQIPSHLKLGSFLSK